MTHENSKILPPYQNVIFYKVLHDIRNMKLLTDSNIEDIMKMDSNEKMEIILVYNSILDSLLQVINKTEL
jgi:hypothetical protein